MHASENALVISREHSVYVGPGHERRVAKQSIEILLRRA